MLFADRRAAIRKLPTHRVIAMTCSNANRTAVHSSLLRSAPSANCLSATLAGLLPFSSRGRLSFFFRIAQETWPTFRVRLITRNDRSNFRYALFAFHFAAKLISLRFTQVHRSFHRLKPRSQLRFVEKEIPKGFAENWNTFAERFPSRILKSEKHAIQ